MESTTTTVDGLGMALVTPGRSEDGTTAPERRRPVPKPQPERRFRLYWDPRRRVLLRSR